MKKGKVALSGLAIAGLITMGTALSAQATVVEECIPSAAYTEVVSEGTPAVAAVYETVTIKEAGWQRYSYKGSWDSDVAPAFPDSNWQANVAGDPHGIGVAGAYFQSAGNSGKVDWFYLEATPAVTEQRLVSEAIPATERVVIEHPEVVCDEPETENIIVDIWEGTDVQWPKDANGNPIGQDLIYSVETDRNDSGYDWQGILEASGVELKDCTVYQMDAYADDEVTASLNAGKKLYAPENPDESWPGGSYDSYESHVFKTECAPPPSIEPCVAFGPTTYQATGPAEENGASNLPSSIDTSNTRAAGYNQIDGNALHTWTTEATTLGKAAGYFATPGLTLGTIGTPSIAYSASSGVKPGFQIVLSSGRILVGEPDYYGDRFWSKTAQAGVPAADGYPASADLNTWFTALGDVAVPYIGYSVGSGVIGDSTITEITLGGECDITFVDAPELPANDVETRDSSTYDCETGLITETTEQRERTYTRDSDGNPIAGEWSEWTVVSSDTREPAADSEADQALVEEADCDVVITTAPVFPTQVDKCATADDKRESATSTEEYTIETTLNEDGSADYKAVANDGFVFADDVVTVAHLDALTDVACPVTTTTVISTLVRAGTDPFALIALALSGLAFGIIAKVRSSRKAEVTEVA